VEYAAGCAAGLDKWNPGGPKALEPIHTCYAKWRLRFFDFFEKLLTKIEFVDNIIFDKEELNVLYKMWRTINGGS
jgi:hypothetical protein